MFYHSTYTKPLTTNFRRALRLTTGEKVQKKIDAGIYNEPKWLNAMKLVPPVSKSITVQNWSVKNEIRPLIGNLLKKYPELRYSGAFSEGNDPTPGNDRFVSEHPVMQFVGRQLMYMNSGDYTKNEAFKQTESDFKERLDFMIDVAGYGPLETPHTYKKAVEIRNQTNYIKALTKALKDARLQLS